LRTGSSAVSVKHMQAFIHSLVWISTYWAPDGITE